MTWYLALRHYYLTINYEFGDFMLSKCASPGCSTPFRYLHEGKLYLIDRKAASAGRKPPADLRYARKSRGLEYVWLCSSCCSDLTIQVDDDHGVRVVRKRRRAERQHPNRAFNAVKTKRRVCQASAGAKLPERFSMWMVVLTLAVGNGLACPNYECGAHLSGGSQSLGQPGQP
jgi:hypothetical protein